MAITKNSQIDLNGNEMILDADGDTTITADTDDEINIRVGGTDAFNLLGSKFIIGDTASHVDDLLQIETPASGGGHGIQIRRNDSNTDQGIGRILFGNNTDTDLATISAKTDGANDSGALQFSTQAASGSSSEIMRITSDGKVGIGKTDPNYAFVVAGTNPKIQIYDSAGSGQTNLYFGDSGSNLAGYIVYQHSDNHMRFGTNAAEAVRIADTGNVSIGYAADTGNRFFVYGNSPGYLVRFQHDGNDNDRYGMRIITGSDGATSGQYWMRFDDGDGHAQGYIYHASGTVQIEQASDERLKENIVDSTLEGINILKGIKQREFNWKRDPDKEKVIGYIAQELETVYPTAVHTNTDTSGEGVTAPEDDPDNPYKFFAKEKLIDVLIKATQEQQTIIEDLKTRIETLEGS